MFISPVSNPAEWNYAPVLLTVPEDNAFRYPGYILQGIEVSAKAGTGQVSIPVSSLVKVKTTASPGWVELEPLLISNRALAARFTAGFPNIYLKLPLTAADTTVTNGFWQAGDVLGMFATFTLAFQFSDRIARDISLAADLILAALQNDEHSSWENFCTALRPQAAIAFVDGSGKSFSKTIRLRFEPSAGAPVEFDYVPTSSSLRELTGNQQGTLRLANPGSDGDARVLWVNGNAAGTAIVSYGTTAITTATRVLQLVDLHEWFAHQTREGLDHGIPRFTVGNRVTPFVNGPAYYRDIFAELNKDASSDSRLFLTGYSMQQDNQLINTDGDKATTLLNATKKIVAANGRCYFLPLQFFAFNDDAPGIGADNVVQIAVVLAAVLGDTELFMYSDSTGNRAAQGLIMASILGGTALTLYYAKNIIDSDFLLENTARAASSTDGLSFNNEGGGDGQSRRIWALHPATWDDNSYTGPPGALVHFTKDTLRGVTAYHQKIAVVKNTEWIAYCGGIDFSKNRMDDERHLAGTPYHDVHARITGPSVQYIANTFIERWRDEISKAGSPAADNLDLIASNAPDFVSSGGDDIVQVARTIFKAAPGSAGRGFDYADTGDRTIIDTLLLSMRNAREYIYIEDQYFTPTPEYRAALMAALDNGLKSLVIVICSAAGQVFSETFRAELVTELLSRNTDPLNPVVRIGFPRRAYTLPPTTSEVMTGRMKIGRDFSDSDTEIVLGPVARVPPAPFWIAVNGELMLVTGTVPHSTETGGGETEDPELDNSYLTYQHYFVERGEQTNFFNVNEGYKRRKHKHGDAATALVYNDVYVHAKCMMIDDMFASIGSANLNRRGFHSDTETNVFVIPEKLRFDPANPVALLRKQLWSEWLNIPFTMGETLLEDPVGASKLFDRDSASGNRFVPYKAVSDTVKTYLDKIGNISLSTDAVSAMGIIKDSLVALAHAAEAIAFDEIFFHVTDPSSFTENPPEPLS